ncbi:MAG: OmpH family outer membrane protein [Pseudomonadota bacterium]|nr:OmpH family outer membrane protein [Gammaproteobacteria bacterium]MBU1628908.1 OmpH family outer membrane protein [Gammaproteobacteria bacterium]MBU1926967.1 OmpH family outer membrane protein [Gammaproteobacteria bacterium]MBU2546601.1 OmpH family outer membrane protein [Gammaproteobacteria bacterium]
MKTKWLALVLGLAFTSSVFAVNIGVVDFQKILSTSPKVAASSAQLQKQFKPQQEKLVAQQKKLDALMAQLKRNDSVMKAGDKKALQDQISAQRASLMKDSQAFQQSLFKEQQGAMQNIMKQLTDVVQQVAKKNNLDIVVARNSVAFFNKNLDYTSQVQAAFK